MNTQGPVKLPTIEAFKKNNENIINNENNIINPDSNKVIHVNQADFHKKGNSTTVHGVQATPNQNYYQEDDRVAEKPGQQNSKMKPQEAFQTADQLYSTSKIIDDLPTVNRFYNNGNARGRVSTVTAGDLPKMKNSGNPQTNNLNSRGFANTTPPFGQLQVSVKGDTKKFNIRKLASKVGYNPVTTEGYDLDKDMLMYYKDAFSGSDNDEFIEKKNHMDMKSGPKNFKKEFVKDKTILPKDKPFIVKDKPLKYKGSDTNIEVPSSKQSQKRRQNNSVQPTSSKDTPISNMINNLNNTEDNGYNTDYTTNNTDSTGGNSKDNFGSQKRLNSKEPSMKKVVKPGNNNPPKIDTNPGNCDSVTGSENRNVLHEGRLANSRHMLIKTFNRYVNNPNTVKTTGTNDLVMLYRDFCDMDKVAQLFKSGIETINKEKILKNKRNKRTLKFRLFKGTYKDDLPCPEDRGYYYRMPTGNSKILHIILRDNGFLETNSKNWTLWWNIGQPKVEFFNSMSSWQKVFF